HLPAVVDDRAVAGLHDRRADLLAQPAVLRAGRACRSAHMSVTSAKRGINRLFSRLRRNESGVALIEFAYSMPILMLLGFTGVDGADLAIASMRVSQITMPVADNLSRAKQTVPLGLPQLREVD